MIAKTFVPKGLFSYQILSSSVILLVPLFTTTTHVSAATEHLNINQQTVDTTFDNDIDENDLLCQQLTRLSINNLTRFVRTPLKRS
jgi:hypothetical protein